MESLKTIPFKNELVYKTYVNKPNSNFYLVDMANEQDFLGGASLGRKASLIAQLLRGKFSVNYAPQLNPNNKVIVINTDKVLLTGKKKEQMVYYSHSGYPGALKIKRVIDLTTMEIVKKAVLRMIPKNKLRDKLIKNLILYTDSNYDKDLYPNINEFNIRRKNDK